MESNELDRGLNGGRSTMKSMEMEIHDRGLNSGRSTMKSMEIEIHGEVGINNG
jgi:hypothetical protein